MMWPEWVLRRSLWYSIENSATTPSWPSPIIETWTIVSWVALKARYHNKIVCQRDMLRPQLTAIHPLNFSLQSATKSQVVQVNKIRQRSKSAKARLISWIKHRAPGPHPSKCITASTSIRTYASQIRSAKLILTIVTSQRFKTSSPASPLTWTWIKQAANKR